MERILLWLIVCLALMLPLSTVGAEETKLELKVLPIDCIFEVVEDGTGEIIYLTPEECGQLIDSPPGSTPPPEEGDTTTGPGTDVARPPYSYLAPFVDIDSDDNGSSRNPSTGDSDKDDGPRTDTVGSGADSGPEEARRKDENSAILPVIIALKVAVISLVGAAWWNGWGWFKGWRK